jgi:hypothetical protein
MVSWHPGFIISHCFLIEIHASGSKKRTWYYSEELKLETNTVLNSLIGIQFLKSNDKTSFLFREALEDKNVITLTTLLWKTKAVLKINDLIFEEIKRFRLDFTQKLETS